MKIRIALLLISLVCANVAMAADEAAISVIEKLHATLLQAMREADQLGFAGRTALIGPVVDASFDFTTIARIVTGTSWKTLDDSQKTSFITVFRELSSATYASNFSAYGGETFVTSGSEDSRGAIIVRTDLVKADGEKIPLNYMLRESDGNWLIVNVIAQGVSDLSLKRADYTAVIKSEGFDALINRLRQKVKEINQNQ